MPEKKWHTYDRKETITYWNTDAKEGLSREEAADRLEIHGPNELPEAKNESAVLKFIRHFNDILIYILLAAAVITGVLGHYIDTVVILLVAFINAAIGYMQENKAEKALQGIRNMLSLEAVTVRDGVRQNVSASELVPGDVVLLNAGDKVPADLRIVESSNLAAEEAALTGESTSSEKKTSPLPEDTVLGDQENMVFSGTAVTSGSGKGIVVAVGEQTEIGKINRSISEVEELKTPLMRQTDRFGKTVAFAILGSSFFIFLFGYFVRDYAAGELLLSIIGLAVAAIPEGLPAIISIILALGVQNMARRKAIVRNLPSVETLGAVTVICSDKTGTLTKNEMTVTSILTKDHRYEVTGTGYDPAGEIQLDGSQVNTESRTDLFDFLASMKTCNDASLTKKPDGSWVMNGEPTEGCLLTAAEKADISIPQYEVIQKIPFDSEYKYMAVLADTPEGRRIFVKGAPDRLFDLARGSGDFNEDSWQQAMKKRASKGERVLAAGMIQVDQAKETLTHEDLTQDFTLLGLAGIIDPPREEAVIAVRECASAGIRVKMITGDHKDTAAAIGRQLGIGDGVKGLEGREIDEMTDEELDEAILEYDIFARTSPDNKLRIVKALQDNDQVAAMTGDGVNDAPALKRADIGVAMGIKGTEAAKESAQMILVDDNFETIVGAVEEGRRVYANLKKTILYILPTNGGQALLITIAILLGTSMPLSPLQILWVNMVIAVTVSLALAFEPLEEGTMKEKPRPVQTPLLTPYYIFRVVFVSILIAGTSFAVYLYMLQNGVEEQMLQSIVLQTIVILQMFHLFNCRNETGFAFNKNFFKNKTAFIVSALLIVLQMFILYVPFMNTAFGTVPIGLEFWIIPAAMGVLLFIVIEIEKTITRKIAGRNN
ncbi:cation-transporting P-type ATPase [Alkalicoccus saliphilus]|uniref:Carbonate dehydratase n=1 Tax=Alkalicoccus saliphilus TaxID=200989 RepID=A0A2T4U354_9BACI|nr:cation-transporting P-type ATPase [Alkalicoccus saliphilus]PTL37830.1 carbonate dehydratase [Alkalicoccus saliphilus]